MRPSFVVFSCTLVAEHQTQHSCGPGFTLYSAQCIRLLLPQQRHSLPVRQDIRACGGQCAATFMGGVKISVINRNGDCMKLHAEVRIKEGGGGGGGGKKKKKKKCLVKFFLGKWGGGFFFF